VLPVTTVLRAPLVRAESKVQQDLQVHKAAMVFKVQLARKDCSA
jgi:hypothetical protein